MHIVMVQVRFLPTLPSLLATRGTALIHRDLSWLQFNDRVLSEARAPANPLLERIKFLAISASNLDEFFMIRIASLDRSIASIGHSARLSQEGRRLMRIRSSILENVAKFVAKQAEAFDMITSELSEVGLHVVRQPRLEDPAFAIGKAVFEEQIFPNLGVPEPFGVQLLSQLENLQIAAIFENGFWFRIPKSIPTVLTKRRDETGEVFFFLLDDLLTSHLATAFDLPSSFGMLRIARDSDITLEIEDEDTASIPDAIRTGLRTRDKGRPIRLQYAGELNPGLLEQAIKTLKLKPNQVFPVPNTMVLHGLWALVNQTPDELSSKHKLKHAPLKAMVPVPFRTPEKIFDSLKKHDYLLHHPYDSFDAYVAWIKAACDDPKVISIEQTVYRTDTMSPVIDALKGAAGRKRVRVVIELRARFDELNNLRLADELRKAGVEVRFGFGKLKLHAKVALVTRREETGDRYYTHLSTGNYSAANARLYTDLAILTANPDIGADAKLFFDSICQGHIPTNFSKLVTAPTKLHRRLLNHIEAETAAALSGRRARIVAKVNALVDQTVIASLYRASEAGVQVDLIVRGACSLIPGVRGLSENIRVISVVDRFLEHSRIYYFESTKTMYLSSADWMPRNFFSRLEIAFPVLDNRVYQYIEQVIIPTYLSDTVKARELTPQGTWKKRTAKSRIDAVRAQFRLEELAISEYKGTPLE